MTTVYLYKYEESDGVIVTPHKRNETDEAYGYRLIADEGYILTDGETETPCVDTHAPEQWDEVEDETYMRDEEQNADVIQPE